MTPNCKFDFLKCVIPMLSFRKLKNPFLGVQGRPLYASKGPLANQLRKNLERSISDVFGASGATLTVTDQAVFGEKPVLVEVVFQEGVFYEPKPEPQG
jgi:hypothetical protein